MLSVFFRSSFIATFPFLLCLTHRNCFCVHAPLIPPPVLAIAECLFVHRFNPDSFVQFVNSSSSRTSFSKNNSFSVFDQSLLHIFWVHISKIHDDIAQCQRMPRSPRDTQISGFTNNALVGTVTFLKDTASRICLFHGVCLHSFHLPNFAHCDLKMVAASASLCSISQSFIAKWRTK